MLTPACSIRYQEGHINAPHNLQRTLNALFTQSAFIVYTRSIQEDDRAKTGDFQSLFHRICRGPGRIGNNGHILSGKSIEQRRLAYIAVSEKRDVQAQSFRNFHHTGTSFCQRYEPFMKSLEKT